MMTSELPADLCEPHKTNPLQLVAGRSRREGNLLVFMVLVDSQSVVLAHHHYD